MYLSRVSFQLLERQSYENCHRHLTELWTQNPLDLVLFAASPYIVVAFKDAFVLVGQTVAEFGLLP